MKDLDQYFDKARGEKEIIPIAEINELLSVKQKQLRYKSGSFIHNLLRRKEFSFATLTILTMLLVSIIAFLVVQDKMHVNQEAFVPQGQRRVMHLVKNISDSPKSREITVSQFGSTTHSEATGIPIHLRSKFELSEDRLKLLGITFFDEYIQYEGNVKDKGYVAFRIVRTGSRPPSNFYPLEVDGIQRPGIKEYEFYPWFMTDEAGYQGFRYRFRDEPVLKTTSSFFLNAIDELIPIQINRRGFKKVIFWFSQTPELMNILESAARIANKTETTRGVQNTDQSNRTIQIEIFPTITKGDVQVIANVLKQQKLEITLLNSSGEVLLVPVDQVLKEGDHHFSMDLSTFRKGLYFVRIKSDPGLITIHRLFKE